MDSRALLVFGSVALLAGCLGSGPDSDGDDTDGTSSLECSTQDEQSRSESPPGLARRADADTASEADGERTLRWDLTIPSACQEEQATASVQVTLNEELLQDCPTFSWRASVTTGLSEHDIALTGTTTLQGSQAFQPGRPDLGDGAGSFVVSLSTTFANRSTLQDDACLDGLVQALQLSTSYTLVES